MRHQNSRSHMAQPEHPYIPALNDGVLRAI